MYLYFVLKETFEVKDNRKLKVRIFPKANKGFQFILKQRPTMF